MATMALNFSKVIELFSGQGHVKDFANHASFSTVSAQFITKFTKAATSSCSSTCCMGSWEIPSSTSECSSA